MTEHPLPPSWENLSRRYGSFRRRHHRLTVEADFARFLDEKSRQRDGEVVLVVRRPDGRVLLHTKPFYPPDTWRLLSGGVQRGESPEEAARREMVEETGSPGRLERLLGVLTYEITGGGLPVPWASAVFLVASSGETPSAQDLDERISGYRWVQPEELDAVAARLRRLPSPWHSWGAFRALAHGLAAESL